MKFEIDTENKIITLRESVKLSEFLKELSERNITLDEWSLAEAIQNHTEIVYPQIYPIYSPDPYRVTC